MENIEPRKMKEFYESKLKHELEEIENLINQDIEIKIQNFISIGEKEQPQMFDLEEKRNFFKDYIEREEKKTAISIRDEMLVSFNQLDLMKNTVLNSIPEEILNTKVIDFQKSFLSDDSEASYLTSINANTRTSEIIIEKKQSPEAIIQNEKISLNMVQELTFSKNNASDGHPNFTRITQKSNERINNTNTKENDLSMLNSSLINTALKLLTKDKNKINNNDTKKKRIKKSLSDSNVEIQKIVQKEDVNINNISNKKNLNNLSNLKNKNTNNLARHNNIITSSYYSDNNQNKDFKQISKNVINNTPSFNRENKIISNEKSKAFLNSKDNSQLNLNIAKRYHSPSPAITKNKKIINDSKNKFHTPNKEK